MVVLPCRNMGDRDYILPCLESIRKHMGDEPVLVVDSDSPDQSYVPKAEALGATVALVANKHYETGAWWYAYWTYPDCDYFYFLHDSCLVNEDLRKYRDPLVVPGYMPGWENATPKHQHDILTKFLPFTEYRSVPDESEWDSIHGSMFLCQRSVLDGLVKRGFNLIRPESKRDSESFERLWGIALTHEGFRIRDCAWGLGENLYVPGLRPIQKLPGRRM